MSPRVNLRSEALEDLRDAFYWYEDRLPGLGRAFLDEVRDRFLLVRDAPEMYPIMYSGVRRSVLRRFPFCLYYRLEDGDLVVIAVMHGSRDPGRWKSRS